MHPPHADHDPFVRVLGSRVHHLRGVDVAAPRDALVAFTGISGSGKSSLAFGTIYAEAQRRYFESVAPYARRLLLPAGAPKVDDITGLPPEQRCRAGLGRSFQIPLPFEHLSVFENLSVAALFGGGLSQADGFVHRQVAA